MPDLLIPEPLLKLRVLLGQRLQYAKASLVFAQKATAAVRLAGLISADVAPAFVQAAEICARLARTMTYLLGEPPREERLAVGLEELEGLMLQLQATLEILQRYAVAGLFAAKQHEALLALQDAQAVLGEGVDEKLLEGTWDALPPGVSDPLEEAARHSHRDGHRLSLPDLTEALAQSGLLQSPRLGADRTRGEGGAKDAARPSYITPGMPADEITGLEAEPLRYSREWFIWREAQRRSAPEMGRATLRPR